MPDIGPQPKERWWEWVRRMWLSHRHRLPFRRKLTMEEAAERVRNHIQKLEDEKKFHQVRFPRVRKK